MMSQTLQVTVIIPALNEEATLPQLLDDLADQSHRPAQVVLIDGGSTDGTRAIASSYDKLEVEVVDNPRQRVPFALNIGLAQARFPLLVRIDAHARVNKDYVKTIVEAFAADEDLGGAGGVKVASAKSRTGHIIARVLSSRLAVGGSEYHYATEAGYVDHIPFGSYLVTVLRELGGWDEQMIVNQDYELDYRIRQSGRKLLLDPRAVIEWHSRESLGRLFHQYYRYGQGKMAVLRKHPASGKPRHFLPLGIVAGSLGGLFLSPAIPMTLMLPLGYLGAVGAVAVVICGPQWRDIPTAAGALLAMQWGYGLGQARWLVLSAVGRGRDMSPSQISNIGNRGS